MFEFIAKHNPLRRTKSYRRIEAMEQQLLEKETHIGGLEKSIAERTGSIQESARELERTAEEALNSLDRHRGLTNE